MKPQREETVMNKSLVEICANLVTAQARSMRLEPEAMASSVSQLYQTLQELHQREEGSAQTITQPENSIQRNHVVCLECGKAFTLLSNRHLSLHGLTPRAYKQKHGLRMTQPLSAQTLSARRRKVARELKMGKQLAEWRAVQKAKAS
jgi:predicted transcriptional regulator